MFKKLRQKIEEGTEKITNQVKQVNQSLSDSGTHPASPAEGVLVDIDKPSTSSTPAKYNSNASVAKVDQTFSLLDGSYSNDESLVDLDNIFGNSYVPSKPTYVLPSDNESEVEADPQVNLQNFTKEEIFQRLRATERSAAKYKNKCKQVFTAFNEAEREREKLSEILVQTQDKARAKLAAFKQQLESDKQTFLQLQTTLETSLNEKNTELEALHSQISHFKEKESTLESTTVLNEEMTTLKEKVKRQEQLLSKCKDTIRTNKEKQTLLTNERDALKTKLDEAVANLSQLESERHSLMSEEAAALRKSVSRKDEEMATLKENLSLQLQNLQADLDRRMEEFKTLQEEHEDTKTKAKEQLEKSREIVKKLQDEKRELLVNLNEKDQTLSKALDDHAKELSDLREQQDEEKSTFMQQVSRVKSETLNLVQQESEKELQKARNAAVLERDTFWQEKFSHLEDEYARKLTAKDAELAFISERKEKEVEQEAQERNAELKLTVEEAELRCNSLNRQLQSLKEEFDRRLAERDADKVHELSDAIRQNEQNHQQVLTLLREELLVNNRVALESLRAELESNHQTATNELKKVHELEILTYQKQVEEIKMQHDLDILTLRKELEELSTSHNSEIVTFLRQAEELKSQHHSELLSLEEKLEQQKSSHKSEIVLMQKQLSQQLEKKCEELSALQQEGDSLEQLKALMVSEKNQALEELTKVHVSELELLCNKHQAEMQSLEAQINNHQAMNKDTEEKHQLQLQQLLSEKDALHNSNKEFIEKLSLAEKNWEELMKNATADHQSEIEQQKTGLLSDYNLKLEVIKSDYEARLSELSRQHSEESQVMNERISQKAKETDERLEELSSRHKSEIEGLTDLHRREMELLKSTSAEEISSQLSEINNAILIQHQKEMDNQKSDFETQISNLRGERESLQNQLDALQKIIEGMEASHAEHLDETRKYQTDLENTHQAYASQITEITEKHYALERERDEILQKYNDLQTTHTKEMDDQLQRKDDLSRQLSQAESRFSDRERMLGEEHAKVIAELNNKHSEASETFQMQINGLDNRLEEANRKVTLLEEQIAQSELGHKNAVAALNDQIVGLHTQLTAGSELKEKTVQELEDNIVRMQAESVRKQQELEEAMARLSEKTAQFNSMKEKAQKTVKKLSEDLKEKTALLTAAENDHTTAIGHIKKEYEGQKEELKRSFEHELDLRAERLIKMEDENSQLKALNDAINGEKNSLLAKIEEREQEIAQLQSSIDTLTLESSTLINQKEEDQRKINKLEGQLSQLDSEYMRMVNEMEQVKTEHSNLVSSSYSKEEVALGLQDEKSSLMEQLYEANQKLGMQEFDLDNMQRDIEQLKSCMEAEKTRCSELQASCDQIKRESDCQNLMFENKLSESTCKYQESLAHLETELTKANDKLTEEKQDKSLLEQQVNDLLQQCEELKLIHSNELTSLVEDHSQKVNELNASHRFEIKSLQDNLQSIISDLEVQNSDKTRQIEELSRSLENALEEIKSLTNVAQTLKCELDEAKRVSASAMEQLVTENSNLKNKLSAITQTSEEEKSTLNLELSSFNLLKEQHAQSIKEYDEKLRSLEGQIQDVTLSLQNEKDLTQRVQGELQTHAATIADQNNTIQELQKQLSFIVAEHDVKANQMVSEFESQIQPKQAHDVSSIGNSELNEADMGGNIERLQALLVDQEFKAKEVIELKDKQLKDVIYEFEEKLSSLNESHRQRETELLAQIDLLQENITFSKSASESPQGTPPTTSHMLSSQSTPISARAKKSVTFQDEVEQNSGRSFLNNTCTAIVEPTELEYLRNILYEYMMGNQTQTLAKVIASVMKFSKEQTKQVILKEEQKVQGGGWLLGSS